MHPTLIHIGGLHIRTYGFFVALGFLAGIFIAKHEAKRMGEDPEKIMDLAFYILISSIIGARIFYITVNLKFFMENPLEIFKIWHGGLVFYGGFIFALIVSIIYIKQKKMKITKTMDILAPSLAAGQFFGRLGCFSAGCCYGKSCDLPWAVVFTSPESLAPTGVYIHPTQLYHAAGNLCIFSFLWFFRNKKKFDGHIFWLYVLLYGATRFIIEFFRGDFRGETFFGLLSSAQVIGCCSALTALVMIIILSKRKKSSIT